MSKVSEPGHKIKRIVSTDANAFMSRGSQLLLASSMIWCSLCHCSKRLTEIQWTPLCTNESYTFARVLVRVPGSVSSSTKHEQKWNIARENEDKIENWGNHQNHRRQMTTFTKVEIPTPLQAQRVQDVCSPECHGPGGTTAHIYPTIHSQQPVKLNSDFEARGNCISSYQSPHKSRGTILKHNSLAKRASPKWQRFGSWAPGRGVSDRTAPHCGPQFLENTSEHNVKLLFQVHDYSCKREDLSLILRSSCFFCLRERSHSIEILTFSVICKVVSSSFSMSGMRWWKRCCLENECKAESWTSWSVQPVPSLWTAHLQFQDVISEKKIVKKWRQASTSVQRINNTKRNFEALCSKKRLNFELWSRCLCWTVNTWPTKIVLNETGSSVPRISLVPRDWSGTFFQTPPSKL